MTRALALAVLVLAGCERNLPPQPLPPATPQIVQEAAAAEAPLQVASDLVSEALPVEQVSEALDAALPNLEVIPPVDRCRDLAAELIVRWEVTSPAYYRRALRFPVWPGGASGVTWGVGYDGGHQVPRVIADDWAEHEHVALLAETAGLTGGKAKSALPRFRQVPTEYTLAYGVFRDRSLIEYERRAERAFRVGMAGLHPGACAALTSLVYNRGGSMTGDSRREMRAIRDECLPALDYSCVAGQIRAMSRLWAGTPVEAGLRNRRNDEARYAEML